MACQIFAYLDCVLNKPNYTELKGVFQNVKDPENEKKIHLHLIS